MYSLETIFINKALMIMSSQGNHSVSCGQIADDNRPTQPGLQVMLVQTAG
jgi:hypothetical protein